MSIAFSKARFVAIVVLASPASLGAQGTRPWEIAVGIGGTTGTPVQDGTAAMLEIGHALYAAPRVTFDLRFTAAHRKTVRRLCFSDQCDVRELATFSGVSLGATAGLLASENTPYVAGSMGAWTGRASYRGPDQLSAQRGALLSAEAGYRVKPFELGVVVHQLDGSVRNVIHLASIVFRCRF